MADMECPKGFRCYESEFEDLVPVEAFPRNGIMLTDCAGSENTTMLTVISQIF
jgi:hypothetical protein